jgi:DNA primase
LLIQRSELWSALDGDAHDLLAGQAAPYDLYFGCIERSLHEHGPLAPSAMLDELRARASEHDDAVASTVLQRIAAFHAPSDETNIAAELARLLDRLRLQAVEEELKLMFETGSATSPDAQARSRELLTIQARLKTQLASPLPL